MKKPVKKKADDSGMTGDELWTKLQKLGFSQVGFARTVNVGDRSVRGWIGGRYPVPTTIAMLVNLMLKTKTTAEDLKA
jgi:DNA-binding transcriptional regulator YiaG